MNPYNNQPKAPSPSSVPAPAFYTPAQYTVAGLILARYPEELTLEGEPSCAL